MMTQETSFGGAALRDPMPLECLSSYITAWCHFRSNSFAQLATKLARYDPSVVVALEEDPDFPKHPNWIDVVNKITHIPKDDLEILASPLGPWHLAPACRVHVCAACLAEQGTVSHQHRCKLWMYATNTICHVHALPLIESPAVGWQWAALHSRQRKVHRDLLLYPQNVVSAQEKSWSKVGKDFTEAIYFSQLSAWVGGSSPMKLEGVIGYPKGFEDRAIWEDLLCLLSSGWTERYEYPLAVCGVPPTSWSDPGIMRFGNFTQICCAKPLNMETFCKIRCTGIRRACVLLAAQAIRSEYMSKFMPPSEWKGSGWARVCFDMPPAAWKWLESRSYDWPISRKEIWHSARHYRSHL